MLSKRFDVYFLLIIPCWDVFFFFKPTDSILLELKACIPRCVFFLMAGSEPNLILQNWSFLKKISRSYCYSNSDCILAAQNPHSWSIQCVCLWEQHATT